MSLSVQPSASLCWAQTIRVADSDLWPPPVTAQVLFLTFGRWTEVSNYISGMLCTSRPDPCGSLSLDWSSLLHLQITNYLSKYLPFQISLMTGCSARPPGPTSISPWIRAGGSVCSVLPLPVHSSEQLEGLWKKRNQIKPSLWLKPSYDFLLNLKEWHHTPPWPLRLRETQPLPTCLRLSVALCFSPPLSSQTHHLSTCHRALALASLCLNPASTGAGFICLSGSRTSTASLPGAPSPVLGRDWRERSTVLLFSSIWHSSRNRQRGNNKYTSKTDLSHAT